MIQPTSEAIRQLKTMLAAREGGRFGLRLWVEKGGCAGWQYAMEVSAPHEGDFIQEAEGVEFYIPEDSVPSLRGINLDYVDSLNDSGFKIHNPNAVRSCGCGTSFEPAEADTQ